jgi:hypothetical protein
MRNVYISVVLILVSLGFGLMGEMNSLHIRDKGYPLFYYSNTGYLDTSKMTANNFNNTLTQYGVDRVPSMAGTNYYLGTAGQTMSTYNMFKDFFMVTTLGVSTFVYTTFPSTPEQMVLMISVASTIVNLISVVSFLRGVGIKWI